MSTRQSPFDPSRLGTVFREFLEQDSGNVAYGVERDGTKLFVKHALTSANVAGVRRAETLARAFSHPALPRFRRAFDTAEGRAIVFDWVEGESLYGAEERRAFCALPVPRVLHALAVIFDLHVALATAGIVATDFYDGHVLYDFDRHDTYVCDLDEYRSGPYELAVDRNLGSTRLMAPEEFVRGARIDERTNVFTMGRCALVLLGDGTGNPKAFRGTSAMLEVIRHATARDREDRHPTLAAFGADWARAAATPPR